MTWHYLSIEKYYNVPQIAYVFLLAIIVRETVQNLILALKNGKCRD